MINDCEEWQMGETMNLNDKFDKPTKAFLGLSVMHLSDFIVIIHSTWLT